jgi:hypothetical protein
LDFLLAADVAQLAVADIDWRLFKEVYQARSRRRLLDDIETAADEEEPRILQRPSLLKRLEGAIATQRRRLLVEHLQKEVAGALGFGDDRKLDGQQGFRDGNGLVDGRRLEEPAGQSVGNLAAGDVNL